MKQVVKDVSFVVLALAVLMIGLPLLVVFGALFGLLFQLGLPVLLGLAILRALWLLPAAIRYRRSKGEWHFQTVSKDRRYQRGPLEVTRIRTRH